ncbi:MULTISPECIES: DUF5700 domain-containing putative Zn-dependent protease [Acidobacteriaceae]|uniref:DUF5700 domain-containing putative Zn-dependent protease n=1 Tax=Acidobacteriaceae TaxID=204434 RepID=UPI00131E47CE|nr:MULTISPECIES: DUF5700 domain-containing putative Zn-dependent protease [Acidobacteriaceae]MDW5267471.1 DUF5700 domain-containing putative Zn-dependent protease [Edaphobacter sp.]
MVWTTVASAATGYAKTHVDATQAQAMLGLLRECSTGPVSAQDIDRVITLPGTQLIIGQQNISRRITTAQYRDVLIAACKGKIAHIEPSEAGARAEKGVQGLTEDVAPSLIWGRQHAAELQKRLAIAEANQKFDGVVPLALKNLPEPVQLAPKLYFVMGGRAGAAASEQGIYIDLLDDLWRSKGHSEPMTQQEMLEFFAHETHHVGYGRILDKKQDQLHLQGGQIQAWTFLVDVLMEGSATLLINAHGSWAELEDQRHIQPDLERLPKLLPESQEILQRSMDGKLSEQEYQTAVSDFFGEGYHATGAKLLYVIEEERGKAGVLAVMDDPRSLLAVYNQCAHVKQEPFRFNPELAKRLKTMGEDR